METPRGLSGAKLEADLTGNVALWDVSHLLARHAVRRYRKRSTSHIVRAYHHHSGALSRVTELGGANGAAKYAVNHHQWPGIAYHFWIPRYPVMDESGRWCVLRTQRDDIQSYHTGGAANATGIGICWQGDLTELHPTYAQEECARALCDWLSEVYPGIAWSYHSESKQYGGSGKRTCPGPHVEKWVNEYRKERE